MKSFFTAATFTAFLIVSAITPGVECKTVILDNPSDIKDSTYIEKAIRKATVKGTESGVVILDGAKGPFAYDKCEEVPIDFCYNDDGGVEMRKDRMINIKYSNLTIRGINNASIQNAHIGFKFNNINNPISNVIIEDLTIETCVNGNNSGFTDSFSISKFVLRWEKNPIKETQSSLSNITIQNNKIITPRGIGILLSNTADCNFYNNDIVINPSWKDDGCVGQCIELFYDVGTKIKNNKMSRYMYISNSNDTSVIGNEMQRTFMRLDGCRNNRIINNKDFGVLRIADKCTNTRIDKNTFYSGGIYVDGSEATRISNNDIHSFWSGISLDASRNTKIYNNDIELCYEGGRYANVGIYVSYEAADMKINNNTVNANPSIKFTSFENYIPNNIDITNNILDGEIITDEIDMTKYNINIKNNEEMSLPNTCGGTVLLHDHEYIQDRTKLYFPDVDVYLFQQKNGRLKLINGNPSSSSSSSYNVLWKSGYHGKRGGGYYTRLQDNGNLVTRPGLPSFKNSTISATKGAKSVWKLGTAIGHHNYIFALRNDKTRLSIFRGSEPSGNNEVWYVDLKPPLE